MKRLLIAIVVVIFLLESSVYACSAFCISQGDLVLVGNNEDWEDPFTKVWYESAEKGEYGRVYFGFDDFYPQGGMNEKGLVFDGFATAPHKVKKSLNKPIYGGNFIDMFMSQCATVDEVLQIFDKYNLQFMERFMYFIADERGDSAIIEGDEIIRKNGKYQIITNFYQSEVKDEKISCGRYKIADAMLKDTDEISVDLCKRVLAATHNEGRFTTVYSNIYDVKHRVVYLYHFHNFQNEVRIDLAKELKKGNRRLDLPALFPKTHAAESFMNREMVTRQLVKVVGVAKLRSTDVPEFFSIDLSSFFNRSHNSVLVGGGDNASFKTWFSQEKVLADGIPFLVRRTGSDVLVSENNTQNVYEIKGIEAYACALHFLAWGYNNPRQPATLRVTFSDGSSQECKLPLSEWTRRVPAAAFDFENTIQLFKHAAVAHQVINIAHPEKKIISITSTSGTYGLIAITLEKN